MKPLLCPRASREAPALVEPDTALCDLLVDLAARMTPEQRGAFLATMAAMDLQRGELSPTSVTLGRA